MSGKPSADEKGADVCVCEAPHVLHSLFDQLHNHNIVAYLRGESHDQIAAQRKHIEAFCQDRNYKVLHECVDVSDKPGVGLHNALTALESADGIIVSDLERLVAHHNDRARDLRPMLHKFLCDRKKHLVAVAEGIDTGSAWGQKAAVEFVTQLKDAEDNAVWFAEGRS